MAPPAYDEWQANPMSLVVDLVTDRRSDDSVCAEVERCVVDAFPRAIVRVTVLAPRDTLAAGHRVAQIASEARPDHRHLVGHGARLVLAREREQCFGVGAR